MKQISWWNRKIGIEEITEIVSAVENKNIGMGKITELLEQEISEILNVPYVVVTNSGSSALFISLSVLGIGFGDEVIIPDRTFIATAHAVQLTGAKVILTDVNKNNTNIDVTQIEKKISSKTKAIIPVHLNGRAVQMDEINEIAQRYNLKVIEDSCQSFMSKNSNNQFLGTMSDLGCFSMGLTKLITTVYGGFIVCHKKKVYKKLIRYRNHGIYNPNELSYNTLGFNFKVSDMMMSMGRTQLINYKATIKHCKKIYNLYAKTIESLDFIDLIAVDLKYEIPLYIEVFSSNKIEVVKYLEKKGISINHMTPSLHLSKHLDQEKFDFDNSINFNKYGFSLPCGPDQKIKDIKYVLSKLIEYNEKENNENIINRTNI